ncbi:hypothetical protein [Streptomyces gilvus]|nr:hypothetical protein [Streptomyces sp. CME 23]MCH5671000.1 hypothetical protein [Streptomyces sp. CME 23]
MTVAFEWLGDQVVRGTPTVTATSRATHRAATKAAPGPAGAPGRGG